MGNRQTSALTFLRLPPWAYRARAELRMFVEVEPGAPSEWATEAAKAAVAAAAAAKGPSGTGGDSGQAASVRAPRHQLQVPAGELRGQRDHDAERATSYDPAGKIPLYNVAVYVPNTSTAGAAAGRRCAELARPGTRRRWSAPSPTPGATSRSRTCPSAANIPLIVQVGKWRMQYTLSNVSSASRTTPQSLAGTKLQMPRNHMEGDIPNIAVSTGSRRLARVPAPPHGSRRERVHRRPDGRGAHPHLHGRRLGGRPGRSRHERPASKQSYQYLWNTDASMEAYDLVLLSCEGSETSFLNDAGRTVLSDYTNDGGRVFASHYHYSWFTPTGPFSMVSPPLATWTTQRQRIRRDRPDGALQRRHRDDAQWRRGFPRGRGASRCG